MFSNSLWKQLSRQTVGPELLVLLWEQGPARNLAMLMAMGQGDGGLEPPQDAWLGSENTAAFPWGRECFE